MSVSLNQIGGTVDFRIAVSVLLVNLPTNLGLLTLKLSLQANVAALQPKDVSVSDVFPGQLQVPPTNLT